jgi:hypothetical protein
VGGRGKCSLRMVVLDEKGSSDKVIVEVGKSYRLNYGKGNPNNQTIHVRGIVDDDIVVYRVWRRRWQSWHYVTEPMYFFELNESVIKEASR